MLGHSEFVGNFETQPADAAEFLKRGAGWVDSLRAANENDGTILDKLRGDQKTLCGMSGGVLDLIAPQYRSSSWEGCVGWARRKFESYFTHRIAQLLHNFPPDATTSQGIRARVRARVRVRVRVSCCTTSRQTRPPPKASPDPNPNPDP